MNEADEKLAIELVDLHAGISGSGLFMWNRSDVLAVAREAIRLTRERTRLEAWDKAWDIVYQRAAQFPEGDKCRIAMFQAAIELRRLSREGK